MDIPIQTEQVIPEQTGHPFYRISQFSQNTSYLFISFNKPDEALKKYKQTWQIETLFRGLKSSGFNLEDTHVTHLDRLEKLVMLVWVAFVWCYKIGDYIDNEIKPIQIKKQGNKPSAFLDMD